MLYPLMLAAASCCSPCTGPADRSAEMARPAPPAGVSGAIEAVDGDVVRIRTKDANVAPVAMTSGWTVSAARSGTVNQVQIGQFVASANINVSAGRGRATELRIFEPGYLPEFGTHQIGAPNTAMTHGFVFGIRQVSTATELDVYYPGGCRVIEVPADVKVTAYDLLGRSAAAPGREVSAVTRPGSDGVQRAGRLVLNPAH